MNAPPGPKKAKAPDASTSRALRKHGNSSPQSTAKSTATEAQRDRILAALRRRPQTTCDLRQLGAFQCATRIKELRELGHRIITTRVTLVDPDGWTHPRAAIYSLLQPAAANSGRGQ